MANHLVTGATGFVGGAIVLELLDRTSDTIIGLTRPNGGDAHGRLVASLREAARLYGREPDHIPFERVRGVAADVMQPGCGVSETLRAETLWHAAASLRYEDRYAEEIRKTNVDGTRHALELARRCGVAVVNQISTAYVAGSREGRVCEQVYDQTGAQNHYERSKVAAEEIVRSTDGFTTRILRPSIVVGHSRTLGATTFSGLYGFTRQLLQYRGALERMHAGLYAKRRMRIRVAPEAPIDFIPVDAVAAQSVAIGLREDASGVYHVTHGEGAPLVGASVRMVAAELGFAEPEFVGRDEPLEWLDEEFDKRLEFYGSYVRVNRSFDRTRVDGLLGRQPDSHRPLPSVSELSRWYVRRLESERQALPPVR